MSASLSACNEGCHTPSSTSELDVLELWIHFSGKFSAAKSASVEAGDAIACDWQDCRPVQLRESSASLEWGVR